MITGYLNRDVLITPTILIEEGTKVLVDTSVNPNGNIAQVQFPHDHPEYYGARTIIPKVALMLDIFRTFETIQGPVIK